uniref:Uncharacterized protein n=1 Tax=Anguilla anguilla TaxID=7936 RepID=A0A0E9T826_ANGAN
MALILHFFLFIFAFFCRFFDLSKENLLYDIFFLST